MLSFMLDKQFINQYRNIREFPNNPVGMLTFYRTYSRKKENGTYESWADVCERVINGMYSIQKDYALKHNRPWNDDKALQSAQEAYDRMFNLKWSPSGRGMWMMGTTFIHDRRTSEALLNCAFITTKDIYAKRGEIFKWFMEMLMLGVGVGSDMRGNNDILIKKPKPNGEIWTIPDTREGWAESMEILFNSYIAQYSDGYDTQYDVHFDYSKIRAEGLPINGFGGISSGSVPLQKLHERVRTYLDNNAGANLTTRTIADIFNAIGACVVAGNIRRSAEILFSDSSDDEFYNLKNYELNPDRQEIGWSSNNSIMAVRGEDYSRFVGNIVDRGEPGFMWLENSSKFGRMGELKPDNGIGANPCGEIILANKEMCNLVEIHLNNHTDLYDYLRTVKFAYLYGKSVTLTYEWIKDYESRQIMCNNRRVGLSNTGVAQFITRSGTPELIKWLDTGYDYVKHYDKHYSGWLGINESIRLTTVKPSGTISLLSGSTPGVHYPRSEYYIRRIRISELSPMIKILRDANFPIERDKYSDNTLVVSFPVHVGDKIRSVLDVSIWEQFAVAAIMQKYWSDNSVSVTISFDPKKVAPEEIARALDIYQYQLKSVSLLPEPEQGAYEQMPYEEINSQEYNSLVSQIDYNYLELLRDAMGEGDKLTDKYCETDACEIKFERANILINNTTALVVS